MTHLIDTINKFDSYFMMSDCARTYSEGMRAMNEIKRALAECSNSELLEVKAAITEHNAKTFNVEALIEASAPAETKTEKSRIMTNAWAMFNGGLFSSFGEALKAAWMKFKLVARLRAGKAEFSFLKADNTVRRAIGTLKTGSFEYTRKGSGSASKPEIIKYFDLDRMSWRSARVDRLVA